MHVPVFTPRLRHLPPSAVDFFLHILWHWMPFLISIEQFVPEERNFNTCTMTNKKEEMLIHY